MDVAAQASSSSVSNTTLGNLHISQESCFYPGSNSVETIPAASNSVNNNHHRHLQQSLVPMHCQANSYDLNAENNFNHIENHQYYHNQRQHHNHSHRQPNQTAQSDWCQQTKNADQLVNGSYINSTIDYGPFANCASDTNSSNTINCTQPTTSPTACYYSSLEDCSKLEPSHYRVGYHSNHQAEYNYPIYHRNHSIWHQQQHQHQHQHLQHHHNLQHHQNLTAAGSDISYHYNYEYYTDGQQLQHHSSNHYQHYDSQQENVQERLAYYQHYNLGSNYESATRSSYSCATNTVEPYLVGGQDNVTSNNNSSTVVGYRNELLPDVNERSIYYTANNAETIAADDSKLVWQTTNPPQVTTNPREVDPLATSTSLSLNTSVDNQQVEGGECSEEEHWSTRVEASKQSERAVDRERQEQQQQPQSRSNTQKIKSGNKTISTNSSSSNSSGSSSNRSSSSSSSSGSSSSGSSEGGGTSGGTKKNNPIQRTNQCGVCGRNYARPSTLKTHLRTHTNERPFKCNVCAKTFSQAANLTAHQRVHTGERPFSCPICGRQFSQSSSVITHLRTHSGERPYRCSMCSRTFSDSSTLTKHCRIHSGEKPYQCDYCPLNFSQSGNLSRHLKLHLVGTTSTINSGSLNPSSICNGNSGGGGDCNNIGGDSSGSIGNGSDGSGTHNSSVRSIGNNVTNRDSSSGSNSIGEGSINCKLNKLDSPRDRRVLGSQYDQFQT